MAKGHRIVPILPQTLNYYDKSLLCLTFQVEMTPSASTCSPWVESTNVLCASSLPTMEGRMCWTTWRQNIYPTLVVTNVMCAMACTRLLGLCTGITFSIIGTNKDFCNVHYSSSLKVGPLCSLCTHYSSLAYLLTMLTMQGLTLP